MIKKLFLMFALAFVFSIPSFAQQSASEPLTLVVASKLAFTTTSLPSATINAPFSTTVNFAGGTAPYTCSISAGALPTGITLGAATATGCPLSGTPTASGSFAFTLNVSDSSKQGAQVRVVTPARP
jgi:large repetitive protein